MPVLLNKVHKKSNFRLKILHKILGLIFLVLFVSVSGAIIAGIVSNKRLENEVSERVTNSFDDVFSNIKNLFHELQNIAEESVLKTSGLVALDTIKEISQNSNDKFLSYTQEIIIKTSADVSTSLKNLENTVAEGFDSTLIVSSDTVGETIEESTKSQEVLIQLTDFRLEALIQANLDGLAKIEDVLSLLDQSLDNLTGALHEQIDENTIQMMSMMEESAKNINGYPVGSVMEKVIPLQEKIKNSITENHRKIYTDTQKEISRVISVIKEQMRLMGLKVQADADKEKIISSQIFQSLFEKSITKVIDIQSRAKDQNADEQQKLSDKISKLSTDVPKKLESYGEEMSKKIDSEIDGTLQNASKVIQEANQSLSDSQIEAMNRIESIKVSSLNKVTDGIVGVGKDTLLNLSSSMLIIAAVFLLLSFFLVSRKISMPLRKAIEVLKDIAEGEGDLTRRLEVLTDDEVGDMAKWFNVFIARLQSIVKDIAHNASTLTKSSENLSGISTQMTKGAGVMSEKTNIVASSADMMNYSIKSVATTMKQSSTNVSLIAAASEELADTIGKIGLNTENARDISLKAVSQIQSASKMVEELGTSAQKIGQVSETINDISEQINLLALNATIEAARAGDAGKGFAVVATEIKALATQTANATNEINDKIESIQKSTFGTVSEIETVSNIINEINKIISTIARSVEEQSITTKEISNNVFQSSTGVQEVTTNISQIANSSQDITNEISHNSQIAKEMLSNSGEVKFNSEELNMLALQLKQLVGKFKI